MRDTIQQLAPAMVFVIYMIAWLLMIVFEREG
jgi:hypothetical protein